MNELNINNTFVNLIYLNETFPDLKILFDLLQIIYFDYTIGTKLKDMGRETVPYFGIENIIVGLKYENEMRGIKRKDGYIKGVLGIDIQCCNKNIHLGISRTKIHITGSKNENMSTYAVEIFLQHVQMINDNFLRLKNTENLNIIYEWLLNHVKINFELNIDVFFEQLPENLDKDCCTFLFLYAYEYKNTSQFMENYYKKLYIINHYIFNNNSLIEKIPTIKSCEICNVIYNFNLGKEIKLKETNMYLINLGYKSSYNNLIGKKIYVVIPTEKEDKIHRFTINKSGSVTLRSSGDYNDAKEKITKLFEDLQKI